MADPYPRDKEAHSFRPEADVEAYVRHLRPAEREVARGAYLAGWNRAMERLAPVLRQWESRWWRAVRETEVLRSQIGELLSRLSQLTDRG